MANSPSYNRFRRRRRNTSGGGGGINVSCLCTSLKLLPLNRGLLAASPASRSVSSFFQMLHAWLPTPLKIPLHYSVIYQFTDYSYCQQCIERTQEQEIFNALPVLVVATGTVLAVGTGYSL